jgi:hypothetical protein
MLTRSIGPYPKPDQSSPHQPSYFSKIHFNITLSPTHWSYPSSSCVLYALTISFSSNLLLRLYLAKNTSYEAPRYAVSSNFLPFHASSVKIFSSAPYSEIMLMDMKFQIRIKHRVQFIVPQTCILLSRFLESRSKVETTVVTGT